MFVEFETRTQRQLAQRDLVRLGPCEIKPCRAKTRGRNRAQTAGHNSLVRAGRRLQIGKQLSGLAVSAHPQRMGIFDFQKIDHLGEDGRHVGIDEGR